MRCVVHDALHACVAWPPEQLGVMQALTTTTTGHVHRRRDPREGHGLDCDEEDHEGRAGDQGATSGTRQRRFS